MKNGYDWSDHPDWNEIKNRTTSFKSATFNEIKIRMVYFNSATSKLNHSQLALFFCQHLLWIWRCHHHHHHRIRLQ